MPPHLRPARLLVAGAAAVLAPACAGAPARPAAAPVPAPVVTVTGSYLPVRGTTSTAITPTAVSAPATTTRPAVRTPRATEAFTWASGPVTAAMLGRSWHSGCPVAPSDLRLLTVSYWGFDARRHTGQLVVNRTAVTPVVAALRQLYAERFPFRRMVPVSSYGGDDNASMAADNTSAFNCRLAVSDGPPSWSMHAYGEAVDIDPQENPYLLDGKVYPPSGRPWLDRADVRPGMVVRGSGPVRAFASVGWRWGGSWSSSPDYQHFSSNGQ